MPIPTRYLAAIMIVIVLAVIATAWFLLLKPAEKPPAYSIVIGTGGVGGVFYYYGATVAGIISNFTGMSATSVQTSASLDNLLLIRDKTDLSKGVIYCATVTTDFAYLAYTGQHERFRDKPPPIAILWAMYPNLIHIITTADSGIKSLEDLRGKRVSTGEPTSVVNYDALLILRLVGIDPARDFAKWEQLGAAENAQALRDGMIDAYFWLGGLPTGSVLELSKTLQAKGKQIYLVPLNETIVKTFTKLFPGIASPGVIPKDVYGTREDTPTLAIWTAFVCHKDTPVSVAYSITKAVFENLPILHKAVAASRDTTTEKALILYGGTIPYHEGALKYFAERGVLRK